LPFSSEGQSVGSDNSIYIVATKGARKKGRGRSEVGKVPKERR